MKKIEIEKKNNEEIKKDIRINIDIGTKHGLNRFIHTLQDEQI